MLVAGGQYSNDLPNLDGMRCHLHLCLLTATLFWASNFCGWIKCLLLKLQSWESMSKRSSTFIPISLGCLAVLVDLLPGGDLPVFCVLLCSQ